MIYNNTYFLYYILNREEIDKNHKNKITFMKKYKKQWWYKVSNFESSLLTENDLVNWLGNCQSDLDKLVLLLLYYTGARPSELAMLTWGNLAVKGEVISINIPTLKRGVGRTIFIPINDKTNYLVEKINDLDKTKKDDLVLQGLKWWNIRDRIYRITNNEMCPYFFRHNRMSQLAEAEASVYDIRYFKGAKSIASVEPYTIRAGTNTRKLARLIK